MYYSEKKYHYVYVTVNLINGKKYVGDRSCNCLPENDSYLGSGSLFTKKVIEYGKENFNKEILEFFKTKKEAFDTQEKYIKQYNTLTPNGYNISPKGGHKCKESVSFDTKQKIRNTLFGVKHSQERIEKNRKSHIGIKYSNDRCEKQRQSMIGKNKGKKMSEEQKEKLKIANLGKTASNETKKKMSASHKILIRSNTHKKNLSNSLLNQKKTTCEYCNKQMINSLYLRWHGEKCKNKI